MDKVKVILGHLQKHHFWVLCGLAIVLGIFGWMSARGSLSEDYTKNKSAVTGKFTSLDGVLNGDIPPNDRWTEEIAKLTKQEQEEVKTTWDAVYSEQQKVLAWPDVMPADFKQFIQTSPPTADIPPVWLAAYQTEVLRNEFPKLAQIVGAAPLSENDPNTGTPKPASGQYKVRWDNQEAVYKALAMPGPPPDSFQVRLRQEDYWVYQALLNIIKATNDASQYTPYIKVIENMTIGPPAATIYEAGKAPGKIQRLASADGGGVAAETVPPPVAEVGGEAPPPDTGRYLDKDGVVLAAGMSQEQQFKRLPVHLRLVMDQREVPRLLTECANYPLPVEVRQLRINPGGSTPTTTARPAAAARPGGRAPAGAAATGPKPGEAFDVTVELNGIIYLFNPPDPAKLGSGGGETQAAG